MMLKIILRIHANGTFVVRTLPGRLTILFEGYLWTIAVFSLYAPFEMHLIDAAL